MKTTHLRRSLAAVGTALVCLLAMSNPAGATLHSATITGGIITSTKTGVTETINLNPTTASCSSSTLQTDDGTTGTTIAVTTLGSSHVQAYSNGQSYLTVLSRSTTGNSAGAYNTAVTPHTVTNLRVAIVATIYNTTSCTPTGTPVCTVAAILNLSGTTTSTSVSSTFSLTGASVGTVAAFPTCAAGPSQIIGTTLTVTSAIVGHLVSSP